MNVPKYQIITVQTLCFTIFTAEVPTSPPKKLYKFDRPRLSMNQQKFNNGNSVQIRDGVDKGDEMRHVSCMVRTEGTNRDTHVNTDRHEVQPKQGNLM